MNAWEKVKTLGTLISIVIIPVLLGVIGNQYTQAIKERDIQGKFVELAVSILNQPPSEASRNLRSWATQVIDKYSGVPLSDATKQDLIDNISITQVEGISERRFKKTDQPRKITKIIISDTHGRTAESAIKLFQSDSSGGTYHYLIDKQGEIYNLVPEEHIAFHTPKHNKTSISIGLVHIPKRSPILRDPDRPIEYEEYSEKQLESLVNLLADMVNRQGLDVNNIIPKSAVSPRKITEVADFIELLRDKVVEKIEEGP